MIRLVGTGAARLLAAGLTLGIAVTAAAGRVLRGVLFGVPSVDAGALAAAAAVIAMVAMAAVEATRALAGYLTGVAAQGTLHDLRVRLFSHLQSLPIRWFDRTPLGEAIAHCTSDIEAIQTLFTSGVASVVIDLSRVVTISIALVALSPPLAGLAALTVPPLLLLTRRLQVQVREAEAVGGATS